MSCNQSAAGFDFTANKKPANFLDLPVLHYLYITYFFFAAVVFFAGAAVFFTATGGAVFTIFCCS